MANVIPEEIVDATWQEVAGMTEQGGRAYMDHLSRGQKELLVFVTAMTEELSVQAHETAMYTFVVICRMFEKSAAGRLPRARRERIAATYEKIHEELGRLLSADERFLERHARVATENEPHVMQYVSEVLLDPEDPEDQVSDEEIGDLFICLKTVVDVLHEVATPA